MINPFVMVRADLKRHVWSSLGILLLLSLAFSATVAVSIFERGLRRAGAGVAKDMDLVVGAARSSLQLVLATVFLQTNDVLTLIPSALIDRLSSDARVARLSPLIFADHWQASPIVGVGPDFSALKPNLKTAEGRWPEVDFELMAGADTGARVGDEIESAHGAAEQKGVEEHRHHEARYRVVGRLQITGTPWDRGLFTPYQSIWKIHGLEAGPAAGERGISAILVKPKSFSAAYALRAEYGKGTTAAVLLSPTASLPARIRWIGLLRALGAGKGYVFMTLWVQSAAVFLLSGIAGAVVGWLGAALLSGFVETRTGLRLPLSIEGTEALILAVFWGAGLAGALLPAWRGFRVTVRMAFIGS